MDYQEIDLANPMPQLEELFRQLWRKHHDMKNKALIANHEGPLGIQEAPRFRTVEDLITRSCALVSEIKAMEQVAIDRAKPATPEQIDELRTLLATVGIPVP